MTARMFEGEHKVRPYKSCWCRRGESCIRPSAHLVATKGPR